MSGTFTESTYGEGALITEEIYAQQLYYGNSDSALTIFHSQPTGTVAMFVGGTSLSTVTNSALITATADGKNLMYAPYGSFLNLGVQSTLSSLNQANLNNAYVSKTLTVSGTINANQVYSSLTSCNLLNVSTLASINTASISNNLAVQQNAFVIGTSSNNALSVYGPYASISTLSVISELAGSISSQFIASTILAAGQTSATYSSMINATVVGTLASQILSATYLSASTATITSLWTTSVTGTQLAFSQGTINNLYVPNALSVTSLYGTQATIYNLTGSTTSMSSLITAKNATITNVLSGNIASLTSYLYVAASVTVGNSINAQVLNCTNGNATTITTNYIGIVPLNLASVPASSSLSTIYMGNDGLLRNAYLGTIDVFNPQTTKGDLVGYTGSSQVRVPIGPNGAFLMADDTQPASVSWGTASVFGGELQYMESNPLTSTTSTNFVTKLTLTTAALSGGFYNIQTSYNFTNANTSRLAEARWTLDGTVFHDNFSSSPNVQFLSNGQVALVFGDIYSATLTAATHTIQLQFRNYDTGQAGISRARVQICRAA